MGKSRSEFANTPTEPTTAIVKEQTIQIANINCFLVITKHFIKKHLGILYAEVFVLYYIKYSENKLIVKLLFIGMYIAMVI